MKIAIMVEEEEVGSQPVYDSFHVSPTILVKEYLPGHVLYKKQGNATKPGFHTTSAL